MSNDARAMSPGEADAFHEQYKLSPMPEDRVEMYRKRLAKLKACPWTLDELKTLDRELDEAAKAPRLRGSWATGGQASGSAAEPDCG